ncbi:DUF2299 domain-containing protein [Methanobacterium alcaliphilum]|uniref:DUF2299 domain-containing protein n=1 Tax=Methanobacterium alcaliphilum TaxID=392018 RepID=UPI002009E60F|nr:DUF2299 family protein [Methanobacterium alcaliphilum]MCK9151129.1 DUF2299 family protein [Methanobacterium alcaliphilum]
MTKIEDNIQKWMADEGYFRQRVPDDTANFHFMVNYPEGHVIDIIQPKGKVDMVVIGCATNVSPEHLNAMQKISYDEREEFIWEFRFTLNNFLVDFQLQHPDNILQSFVVSEEIYEDGMNKDRLISTVKRVFRAKLQGLWKIQHKFGEVEKDEFHSDSMYV